MANVYILLVIGTIVGLVVASVRFSLFRKEWKQSNILYTCTTCGSYRREYQIKKGEEMYGHFRYCPYMCTMRSPHPRRLRDRKSVSPQPSHGFMEKVKQEFKWMAYTNDFPKLSMINYIRYKRIQTLLTHRRTELEAYRSWADHWEKQYGEECPVSEDTVIDDIGGHKWMALLDSGEEITLDNIRRDDSLSNVR